jgi:hypothetical protein
MESAISGSGMRAPAATSVRNLDIRAGSIRVMTATAVPRFHGLIILGGS